MAFLQCFREAHQEVFGMLEVMSMIDFLILRLRGALHEFWMEDVSVVVRRCVVAGRVSFFDLCGFVTELIPIWKSVREYVRFTGARHLKSSTDRVSLLFFLLFLFPFSFFFSIFVKIRILFFHWSLELGLLLLLLSGIKSVVDAGSGLVGILREYECVTSGSAQACFGTL